MHTVIGNKFVNGKFLKKIAVILLVSLQVLYAIFS